MAGDAVGPDRVFEGGLVGAAHSNPIARFCGHAGRIIGKAEGESIDYSYPGRRGLTMVKLGHSVVCLGTWVTIGNVRLLRSVHHNRFGIWRHRCCRSCG